MRLQMAASELILSQTTLHISKYFKHNQAPNQHSNNKATPLSEARVYKSTILL